MRTNSIDWRIALPALALGSLLHLSLAVTPVRAQAPAYWEADQLARQYLDHARSLREAGLWQQVLMATELASGSLGDTTADALHAEIAITRAGALQALERSRESLEIALPALEIVRNAGLHELQLRALLNISSAYSRAGQHEPALEAISEGLSIAERLGNAEQQQRFLLNRARIYLARGDTDDMRAAVAQAAAVEREKTIPELDVTMLLARLSAARSRDDLDEAKHLARLSSAQSDPESFYGAFARESLADLLCSTERSDEALDLYKQALTTFEQLDVPWDHSRSAMKFSACLEQLGHWPEALKAMQISREQLGLAHARRQAEAVAALDAMTGAERLQGELLRAHLENQALASARAWQRAALAAALVVVLALMLWGGLQFTRQKSMWHLARLDSLTGLTNRRGLEEQAGKIFARRRRAEGGPALLSIDLDHFKQVNDRFGHAAGDRVLETFSGILQASARPNDLIGRMGGEEFSMLLPAASPANAVAVAERIRGKLESTDFSAIGSDLCMTCSIGVALAEEDGVQSVADLMALADRRLYQAKNAGRNQVVS